jgi:hypothetical protein
MSAVLVTSPEEQAIGAAAAGSCTPASEPGFAAPATWEELYHAASPAQQAELLARARAQGMLYPQDLPAVPRKHGAPAADKQASPAALARFLTGQVDDLPCLRPAEVDVVDVGLDGRQREAVARAVGTPDVCLLQGWPGTGKSRVVAEILTQATVRGERVLFLAPSAAALDHVLALVASRATVCAWRCLAPAEMMEGLPSAVRALTVAGRARQLRQETLPAAQAARAAREKRCACHRREETIWPQLLDFADNRQHLAAQLSDLHSRRAAMAAEVERETAGVPADAADEPADAGSLVKAFIECVRSYQAKRRDLETALAKAEQQRLCRQEEVTALAARLESLRPLAEAKQRGRWWTPAWWRATFRGHVLSQSQALADEHHQATASLQSQDAEVRQAQEELCQVEEAFHAEQARLRNEEIERRQADLADQEAAVQQALALLDEKSRQLCGQLPTETDRTEALTPGAVQQAHDLWQASCARDREARDLACQWATYLEDAAESVAEQLPAYANLVAAPLAALPGDAALARAGAYDLLLLEEADQVSEAELLPVAGRARRWVLVGAPAPVVTLPARLPPAARGRPRSLRPAPALEAGCFHRLWGYLHCDPSRLPYVWAREHERLCCRLHPVPIDQRHRLESERVADFPEIELRILNLPRATPVLAEVLFPPAMSIEEAKGYIYRELQELPVQAAGGSACWVEEPGAVVFRMGGCAELDARAVRLEDGVRELVASGPCGLMDPVVPPPLWHTCRLEFDRASGWHRERAEEWVRRHLRLRDLGRTITLDTLHRMAPPLAAVLADILGHGASHTAATGGDVAAVEFVAVPPLERSKGPGLPRAGAGLELDLSGPRQPDRLPSDLRARLPAEGLVNYLEAQAVVRQLKRLLADPCLVGGGSERRPVIAVMALYPAQVTLLRELIRRASLPAADGPVVEVHLPHAFRHRECQASVISLTRSHGHRTVALAESPDLLTLALTRARTRVVLVGDVGTLARRGQWQGALDHLDEHAAAREGRLVGRLLSYLHGQGRHSQAFRLCEGDGT